MRGSEFVELRAFTSVVECASFARAAGQLGLSASALSQTIRKLEERLGVRLFNRTTRSVAPTVAGQRLYDRFSPILHEMDAAVAEAVATAGRVAGPLRINAPTIAALHLIAPRLKRFGALYPEIELDLIVDDGLTDIVAGRFDAGIRAGERLEKDVIAVRVTPDMEMLAVASPDYLAQHGEPTVPADLHGHRCINWRFPGSGNIYQWDFSKGGKQIVLDVRGPLITNSQELALQAALMGLGIVYTYDPRIYGWINEGRLKRLLTNWSPTFPGLFLYYSNKRHGQPALRAFIDCLLDRGDFALEMPLDKEEPRCGKRVRTK
jgi:DNA-binding transcriptional LysR family regulator